MDASLKPQIYLEGEATVEQVYLAFQKLPDTQKYEIQVEVMEWLLKQRDTNAETISQWYSYAFQSGVCKDVKSEAGSQKKWQQSCNLPGNDQDYYTEFVKNRAILQWGESNELALFTRIKTRTTATNIGKLLSQKVSHDKLKLAGNLARASTFLKTEELLPPDIKKYGLKYDQDGYLAGSEKPPSPEAEYSISDPDPDKNSGGNRVYLSPDQAFKCRQKRHRRNHDMSKGTQNVRRARGSSQN
ncbi:hypothetical protein N7540_006397 [Penicillium herquei]|nr:hypothetical protein N7540_006397 [Penicillium herquei]